MMRSLAEPSRSVLSLRFGGRGALGGWCSGPDFLGLKEGSWSILELGYFKILGPLGAKGKEGD